MTARNDNRKLTDYLARRRAAAAGGSQARASLLTLRCSHCGMTTEDPKRVNAVCDVCCDGVMVRGAVGTKDA